MIQYNNIVRANEHISLNVKTVYTSRQDFVFDENSKAKVTITRNLIDDTFDIEIPNEVIKKTSTAPVTPYVSINNTLILEGRELGRQTQGVNPNNRTFKIYHGMMRDFKFRDIKQLYVGTMVDDIVCCVYLIDINFSEMNNHIDISRGQVAEVAGFKKLTFELDHGLETSYRTQPDKTLRVKVAIEKTRLLYKPIERNRTDAITDIAEIYVYTGDEDSRLKGILPDVRSDVKSTGVPGGMSTLLNKEDTSETIDVEDEKDAPVKYKHLYSSSIDTSTYYDYEKMKTVVGYSSDSKEGEFIPFGFSGTYSWIHKLRMWHFIKDFEFRYNETYDHSLLNPFDGDVILNIDNSYESPLETNNYISIENIQMIKNSEVVSLRGLLRISNEKGE